MAKRSLTLLVLALTLIAAGPARAIGIGGVAPGGQEQAVDPADKVDVNHADEEQLQTVPGIGPAMAQRIVEWRAEHGPFERLEDLLDIRGIGTKTLEKLRPYLTLGDEGSTRG